MQIAIKLPEDIAAGLESKRKGLPRRAIESLAKRERKDLVAGINEFNPKGRVFDRPLLPDKLIHSRLSNLAGAIGAGIGSMVGLGRGAIQLYLEANGRPFFDGLKTIWRSHLWNRNTILPGADSSVPLSAPAFHNPPSPH